MPFGALRMTRRSGILSAGYALPLTGTSRARQGRSTCGILGEAAAADKSGDSEAWTVRPELT